MFNWKKIGLRNQFFLIFVIIQIFILGFIFYYFIQNHINFYYQQLENNLRNQCKLIINNEKIDFQKKSPAIIDSWVKEVGKDIGTRITIVRKDGTVLADSNHNPEQMDNHADRPEIKEVLNGAEKGVSSRWSNTLAEDMYYVAYPLVKNGDIIGVVRLARSAADIKQTVIRDIKSYFYFLILILLITILLVWKFSASLIKPITRMAEMAGSIASGNLKERIELKSYDNEVGFMARMFNYMAEQLEIKIDEISDEKNRAEAILSSMSDGVIATDQTGKIIMINPAACKMLNVNSENVVDKDLIEVVRSYKVDEFLQQAIGDNENFTEEITMKNPDKVILLCNFAPVTNEKKEVAGGVIVFTDITELRELEQIRKDFVANVSHELKTPLTSVIGYVDTLLDNKITDLNTIERFLKIIKKEADRLALLITDLLSLSRVENKNPDLKPNRLDEVIEKPISILRNSAAEKGITIVREIEDNLPLVLMVPGQIEQVLINLIDNSIKYTSEGGTVKIRAHQEDDLVYIEVEDSGIGIPAEDLNRIFERFYRVDKARSRALGGTGIGLSIVKHIIQGHDSKIEVESEQGSGTLFRFYLKVA